MEHAAVWGINHLKLPATDIAQTKDFYCDVMGCESLPHYDHYDKQGQLFAVMFQLSHQNDSKVIVEVRKSPAHARAQAGWDPITFGVETRADLESWKAWFEMKGVKCSRVFRGLKGWVSCALDPDGKIVRLYCNEEHEWDSKNFDEDEFWLGSPSDTS